MSIEGLSTGSGQARTASDIVDQREHAVEPVLAADGCSQNLPAWGVTRDFRFGQFVRLYDERVVGGRRQTLPIVLTSEGDITENPVVAGQGILQPGVRLASRNGRRAPGGIGLLAARAVAGFRSRSGVRAAPAATVYVREGQLKAIGLDVIASGANLDDLIGGKPVMDVEVVDVDKLLQAGTITVNGTEQKIELEETAAARLRNGDSVLVIGRSGDSRTPVRLVPRVITTVFNRQDLGRYLNAGFVPVKDPKSGATLKLWLRGNEAGIRTLLDLNELVAPCVNDSGVPQGLIYAKLVEPFDEGGPAASSFVIEDPIEFLAVPIVPREGGGSLRVVVADVERFLLGEQTTGTARGHQISLFGRRSVPPLGTSKLSRARPVYPKRTLPPGSDPSLYTRSIDAKLEPAFSLAREGLPVALLLPWKQTWTLTGFSRGNLLSTLALAPGEDTTITVASWERRAKALVQTAETEVEQTFDFTSTTRDTEDVFREVTSSSDFSAQAHASVDASYSPGVASIHVEAGGNVSNTQSLANICRNSSQHMRESTSRAGARVRSRRVTTITESTETETRNQVVRHIRNPNECHTLTMNFHEVLAHYDVDVRFNKAGVRIVIMIPNPVRIPTFDQLAVRVNEAVLRQNLLDGALTDGFEACRLLVAYERAAGVLQDLSNKAKKEREPDRERTNEKDLEGTEKPTPKKPANPQLAPLVAILTDIKRRARDFVNVDIGPALEKLKDRRDPDDNELVAGKRWLWRRLVATKFGSGLLTELDRIAAAKDNELASDVAPNLARSVVAAIPPSGSYPALDALSGLGDKEKEDAGLRERILGMPGYIFWDWEAWYGNTKRHGLYDAEDGGLPGALTQLRTTFHAWEAKESEGTGLQAAGAVIEQAKQEQAAQTIADRLEMKFGAEMVGSAMERSEALLAHLNQHKEYYEYVLFQALPPSEQLQRLMERAPQLRVGMFEPHVVASDGPNLAVPLSPVAESVLMKVVASLAEVLEKAATEAEAAGEKIATDKIILPTPGMSVESWLGECSACEDHVEGIRATQLREAVARAKITELEADRRAARLAAKDYSDPDPELEPRFRVDIAQDDGQPNP